MRSKIGCIVWLILIHGYSVMGQGLTQSLTGKVVDATTNEPLIGVNVVILDGTSQLGALTDIEGSYTIKNVPVGRQNIRYSYVGYEPVTYNGILLTTAKPYVLDVAMNTTQTQLEELVVTAVGDKQPLNNMAKVSARSFSIEESQRFAGGLSDPSRVAHNFPGVTFGNMQDNGVVVRGNSPANILWRIEGIEVPGASHFGGGNLAGAGLITIFSAQVMGTSDFISGAFPAEYGNATAGVFDINFRKGVTDNTCYTAQLGVLGADLAIEGPLGKQSESSYLVNYRHGFIGYYGKMAGGAEPYYQDLSYKINLVSKKAGTFSFWGIGGLSSIFTPYGKYEVDEGEVDRRETATDFEQDDIAFDVGAVGLSHRLRTGKKTFLNTTLAATHSGYNSKTDWFTPDNDTLNTGTLTPYTAIKSNENKYTLRSTFTYLITPRISHTTGVVADLLHFNYRAKQADRPLDQLTEFLNTNGNTYALQAYSQSNVQVMDRLSLQAGVNLQYFNLNGETTLEPRAGLQWQPLSRLKLGVGYGLHTRREEPKIYLFTYTTPNNEIRNNTTLKRKKAHHFIVSAGLQLTHSIRVELEGYYQHLFDIPVVADSAYSFANYTQLWELDKPLSNEGTGTNKGIDFTLEQSFHNNYYYLLTASVFDSKYTGGDGVERNTLFNRGYLTGLAAGKEFVITRKKKNQVNLLGFNFNVNYMGGQRTTPIRIAESEEQQRAIFDYDQLYSRQARPELWINAGITYKINKEKRTATWGLDFQNATLNQQFQGYEYNFVQKTVTEERVLFLMPNFYYKLEF